MIASPRILFVLTSHDVMGASMKPTGFWAEELAVPYYLFKDSGAEMVLASPKGGRAPVDPGSIKPKGKNPEAVERMLEDLQLSSALDGTRRTETVTGESFDAVFLPGGHGTMWDLPNDDDVRLVIERAFNAGKVVASVCHGAAGLVSARRRDGKSILFGMHVNAFTNQEEVAAGLSEVVPFPLETRIRDLGGIFDCAAPWQEFAIRDGNLATGQNPQSSAAVARLVLNMLEEQAQAQ